MYANIPSSPKELFTSLTFLFYTMITGFWVLAGIIIGAGFLVDHTLMEKSAQRFFFIGLLFLLAACLTAAETLYKSRLSAAKNQSIPLVEKRTIYRTALIIYLALCEGPAFFALISYYLTGNIFTLAAAVLCWVAMLMKRPEKFKLINELDLNSSEQMELI
jgi:hypothetical protein